MSQTDFFDFSNLLKGPLMVHKLNTDKEQFKWQPVSWLQYTKTHKGVLNYKTTLEENEPFKTLSFLRRGNKKKKDLLDLLPLISPIFHQFYSDLKTTNETQDNDPDIDELFNNKNNFPWKSILKGEKIVTSTMSNRRKIIKLECIIKSDSTSSDRDSSPPAGDSLSTPISSVSSALAVNVISSDNPNLSFTQNSDTSLIQNPGSSLTSKNSTLCYTQLPVSFRKNLDYLNSLCHSDQWTIFVYN
ncbi:hypothetical protein AGLY_012340 [Aphis glycines]|uniref:Uncharacterized protein n=1 Tax=Aphis glycines TaxID=307491 RepID=A0A6G0TAF3_APHGL|nr:hypothetical protein AGLY_012340 [Aphis glycines]